MWKLESGKWKLESGKWNYFKSGIILKVESGNIYVFITPHISLSAISQSVFFNDVYYKS